MKAGDGETVFRLFEEDPELKKRDPFSGATWLHYAIRYAPMEMVRAMLGAGFDVNQLGERNGDPPIDGAFCQDRPDVAEYLIDQGAELSTNNSKYNPLFSSVIGRSKACVELLLKSGVDPTVSYGDKHMTAAAFALWRGESEIAKLIAEHICKGDPEATERYLTEAKQVALRHASLQPTHIIPVD